MEDQMYSFRFFREKKQGMEYDVSLHIKKLEKGEQIKPKVEKWEWQLMKQKTDKQKTNDITLN